MKLLRRLIAVILCAGLNFSLCTGGLLSISSALAIDVSRTYLDQGATMTPAVADTSLCAFMTPVAAEEKEDRSEPAESNGCAQGEACLLSAAFNSKERAPLLLAAAITLPEPLQPAACPERSEPPSLARDGPRHEEARLLASVLLKRE